MFFEVHGFSIYTCCENKFKRMKKLIIIGSASGGLPVASRVARYKPESFEITVITRDHDIAYSPCGIPFVLKGDIPSYESLIMRSKEDYERQRIKILTCTTVEEIDSEEEKVYFNDTCLDYDYLVIATGTSQKMPEKRGIELEGVFSAHIKTLKDARDFEEYLSRRKPLKAVITGSGSIDLEIAVGLKEQGHEVTVVEKRGHLMSDRLDSDMAEFVKKYLQSKGINIIMEEKLLEIKGKESIESAVFENLTLPADVLLLGTDFIPNVELAKRAGFDTDEHGIIIDDKAHVLKKGKAMENVFASGACARVLNRATGKPDFMYFGSTSIQSSRIVAEQLIGKEVSITGSTNPRIAVLWDMYIGAVGLTSIEAAWHDIEITGRVAEGENIARYYPGGVPVYLKLLFEKNSLRLVGAQVISTGYDVKERVDALSIAMHCGLTAKQLAHIETAYTPPVATIIDLLVEAASKAWLGDED